jgi:hypothetical protein
MRTARELHVAVALGDGRVLVAGGRGAAGTIADAEVYEPRASRWSVATSMLNPTDSGRATRLADGRVLVVGGYERQGSTMVFDELYDRRANAWTSATSSVYLVGEVLARLVDGRVLAAGGEAFGPARSSVWLFAPKTSAWTRNPFDLSLPRDQASATRLRDGRVLIAGGFGAGGTIAGSEVFDPGTGRSTPVGSLAVARWGHAATLLPIGKVLVVGGHAGSEPVSGAELYDPATGRWTPAGALTVAHYAPTATTLVNGMALVVGDGSAELYDPIADRWTSVTAPGLPKQNATATLMADGRVLVAGGSDGHNATAATEIFTPSGPSSTLALARTSFAAAPSGASLVRRRQTGTQARYVVSAPARAVLRIQRRRRGVMRGAGAGRHCVVGLPGRPHGTPCIAYVILRGTAQLQLVAGLNRFRLTGRWRGRALPPGVYRLLATPRDTAKYVGGTAVADFRVTG